MSAVATQDTVTQLISAIRRVRRVVPVRTSKVSVLAHDYEATGKPLNRLGRSAGQGRVSERCRSPMTADMKKSP